MAKYYKDPKPLTFKNANGRAISSWAEWEGVFEDNANQFVPHRSAYSLAQFMLDNNGSEYLRARVSQLLPEKVDFYDAVPELEVRFDKYGKGRFHDLGIYGVGQDSKQSLFVGVEAKVDEPFGEVVKDVYDRAMARRNAGVTTNVPDRIDDLLALHFPASPAEAWKIRYQLLYATAGTLAVGSGLSVLYTIVFRTPSYDAKKGNENERAFRDFMKLAGATELGTSGPAGAYKLTLGGKDLYCVYEYYDRL